MKINLTGKSSVTIDGKSFVGRSITINGDKVFVDGVQQEGSLIGDVNVTIAGNVETIELSSGKVEVQGSAGSVHTQSGDVVCGNIAGSASTMSGDIHCGNISGNASTMSGDIYRNNN